MNYNSLAWLRLLRNDDGKDEKLKEHLGCLQQDGSGVLNAFDHQESLRKLIQFDEDLCGGDRDDDDGDWDDGNDGG